MNRLPVEMVVVRVGHRESIRIVRVIVGPVVIAGCRHVRNISGHGLDLPHEFVSKVAVLVVQIVGKVLQPEEKLTPSNNRLKGLTPF